MRAASIARLLFVDLLAEPGYLVNANPTKTYPDTLLSLLHVVTLIDAELVGPRDSSCIGSGGLNEEIAVIEDILSLKAYRLVRLRKEDRGFVLKVSDRLHWNAHLILSSQVPGARTTTPVSSRPRREYICTEGERLPDRVSGESVR